MGQFENIEDSETIKVKAYNMALDHAISITKAHRALMVAIPGTQMIVENIDVLLHQFELMKQPVNKIIEPDPVDMVENAGPNREPNWHRKPKSIMQERIEAGEHHLDPDYNNELTAERDPDLYAPNPYDEEPTEP